MDSLFSQILAGVISGVVTEFVVKLAIKAVKRKSSKKTGGAYSKSLNSGDDIFSTNSNKKDVSKAFYLSFILGMTFILLMVFVDFKKLAVSIPYLNSVFDTAYLFLSFFSTMFFVNHFLAFHEALEHWNETPHDEEPAGTKTNGEK